MNPVAIGECHVSDPCIYCSSGMGHPPLIVVYDPRAGAYVRADTEEHICIARNASSGCGHTEDDVCGSPAVDWVGDVPLCGLHLKRLMREVAEDRETARDAMLEREIELHERRKLHEEELHQQHLRHRLEQTAAESLAKSSRSVVYYVRRSSDGAVKIGFTGSMRNRMAALRGEHGPLQVLLALGGDRIEEAEAHDLFRKYRIGRTEWFRPVRPLFEWIREAREGHTHPDVQPGDAVPLDELGRLVLAAVPEEELRWDDDGFLQWPPGEVAA